MIIHLNDNTFTVLEILCFRWFIVVAATAAVEGKMSKSLKKLLKKLVIGEAQEQLAVADAKLGSVIKASSMELLNLIKFILP